MVYLINDSSMIGNIYDEFYRDVYHFALYFTNSKHDAEDITQETFIKVLNSLHLLKDQSKKKSWILSIARNTAVDLIRKQKLIRILPDRLGRESTSIKQKSNIIAEENWMELQTALLKLK